jgi:hypothetical protein
MEEGMDAMEAPAKHSPATTSTRSFVLLLSMLAAMLCLPAC